jgi:hypothetical protein
MYSCRYVLLQVCTPAHEGDTAAIRTYACRLCMRTNFCRSLQLLLCRWLHNLMLSHYGDVTCWSCNVQRLDLQELRLQAGRSPGAAPPEPALQQDIKAAPAPHPPAEPVAGACMTHKVTHVETSDQHDASPSGIQLEAWCIRHCQAPAGGLIHDV